jgi:hypothetical protein
VSLRVSVPKGSNAPAGLHVFVIRATSRDDPSEVAALPVRINVAASGAAATSMALEPQRINGRKGLYAVKIFNAGNSPVPLVLTATDPEEALYYTFGTPKEQPIAEARAEPYKPVELGASGLQGPGILKDEIEVPPGTAVRGANPGEASASGVEREGAPLPVPGGHQPPRR